jgi:hypothetical protein
VESQRNEIMEVEDYLRGIDAVRPSVPGLDSLCELQRRHLESERRHVGSDVTVDGAAGCDQPLLLVVVQ